MKRFMSVVILITTLCTSSLWAVIIPELLLGLTSGAAVHQLMHMHAKSRYTSYTRKTDDDKELLAWRGHYMRRGLFYSASAGFIAERLIGFPKDHYLPLCVFGLSYLASTSLYRAESGERNKHTFLHGELGNYHAVCLLGGVALSVGLQVLTAKQGFPKFHMNSKASPL